ncbi:amidohydrolase family protein [Rhodococcus sp. WAY2]|uniref:amidohydrolase family protein n=1 Tax=Rhodococcus sp. WAY2 TaxID=2663121 RepID=UPI0013204803|nr:amidohydrolase family protein [Rhodococcus sp. WAY2]QHE73322.1 BarH [Rhodococcus sp. WAY2]
MTTTPLIISVDDHVVEPPNVWIDRLPAKYRDRAPRVERVKGVMAVDQYGFTVEEDHDHPEARWADIWVYEDLRMALPAGQVQVGKLANTLYKVAVTFDEADPGVWQQKARLAAMDENHIEAALMFPTMPRFCGQTFKERSDKAFALLCLQAYNDWMIDEWCAGDGYGRLIPVTLIPLWDVDLAIAEVERCVAKGAHAITFSENPAHLDLPSIHSGYWDPLWAVCEDNDVVVNMHIGSSSRMPTTAPDAPPLVGKSLSFLNSLGTMMDWLASGILPRHPKLRIALSESQVGWIPFVLGRLDNEWELGHLFEKDLRLRVPERPSAYMNQIYGCIFDDLAGLEVRDRVGMSQIMFETDYPHGDTSYPYSRQMAEKLVTAADLSEHETWQLLRGNAISCYRLDRYGITK